MPWTRSIEPAASDCFATEACMELLDQRMESAIRSFRLMFSFGPGSRDPCELANSVNLLPNFDNGAFLCFAAAWFGPSASSSEASSARESD
jgi:hypothetical protein